MFSQGLSLNILFVSIFPFIGYFDISQAIIISVQDWYLGRNWARQQLHRQDPPQIRSLPAQGQTGTCTAGVYMATDQLLVGIISPTMIRTRAAQLARRRRSLKMSSPHLMTWVAWGTWSSFWSSSWSAPLASSCVLRHSVGWCQLSSTSWGRDVARAGGS